VSLKKMIMDFMSGTGVLSNQENAFRCNQHEHMVPMKGRGRDQGIGLGCGTSEAPSTAARTMATMLSRGAMQQTAPPSMSSTRVLLSTSGSSCRGLRQPANLSFQ